MTIACPDCGALETLPQLSRGGIAVCRICAFHLESTRGRSIAAGFACAAAALLLLIPANLAPFLSVSMLTAAKQIWLPSGVVTLWQQHWALLAILVCLFAVVLPFFRFGLLVLVLGTLLQDRRPHWLGPAYRWAITLDHWAMPDVFLIGAAVGYSRVTVDIPVHIGAGGYCFIAVAMLAMLQRGTLDRRAIWRRIGGERLIPPGAAAISCTHCDLVMPASAEGELCPRCSARLHARKPYAMGATLALVITGFLLYLPSNLFPMSVTWQLEKPVPHTIFSGVKDLFDAGLAPLGLLIFCTSIAIPMAKLVGLSWCLWSVHRRSARHLVFKTKLCRFIDEVGRWSNIDPFTIAVIAPLFQFPPLVSSHAAPGAVAFITVVAATMMASRVFDPRLMWDAAEGGHDR